MLRRSRGLALAAACGVATTLSAAEYRQAGGDGGRFAGHDNLSVAFYQRVERRIAANVAQLRALGVAQPEPAVLPTVFDWPLRATGVGNFHVHGTSNFVDQDDTAGLADWFCTERTYDGHRGTDFFTHPYGFLLMDESRVEILAAAAGTIVDKDDGNFDRRCACITDDPNYVILEHPDGRRSWYLHMKSGSVTTKGVGDAVAAGEQLGIVGSSGCSSGPHLHFELRDAGAEPGAVLDPYDGACNGLNAESLWLDQPDYRQPAINRLATGFAPPVLPACPTQETPNEQRLFEAGESVYIVTHLRDEDTGLTKFLSLLRPDGALYDEWQHTTDADYDWSYWWWTHVLPDIPGRWRYRVTFDGVLYERAFWIGALFADDFEEDNLEAWSAAVTP